jgi:hypothetical protein
MVAVPARRTEFIKELGTPLEKNKTFFSPWTKRRALARRARAAKYSWA